MLILTYHLLYFKINSFMNSYDVIVIGGGLTGSVLSYELAKKKLKFYY